MASAMTEKTAGSFHSDHKYSVLELDASELGSLKSPRVLSVLSSLFGRSIERNEKLVQSSDDNFGVQRRTVFHGLRAPPISIEKYLERIFKYANCSPSCFVVAYVYLDRFIHQQSGLPITSLNVHRLLITSVMVAAKFLDDACYNNSHYAKVGGVSIFEMNRLELEFLFRLGFRLHVTLNMFESYCSHLEREVAVGSGHQIERPLLFTCGRKESSLQDSAQNQMVVVRCSYEGL